MLLANSNTPERRVMARIVWNDPADRRLFGGTDQGVLYIEGRAGVPWNGINSIVRKNTMEADSVYYEGRRIIVVVDPGTFEGTLSAYNYPEEFERAQGFEEVRPGVYASAQKPVTFGLSYRTSIRDANGKTIGHEIHLFWNLTAVPADVSHTTLGGPDTLTPFTWEVLATATELPGIRPTAHLSLKTTEIDPWLIEDLEKLIYGTAEADPYLPPLAEFYETLMSWARFWVTVDGDEWTGTEARANTHIQPTADPEDLLLVGVDVSFIDADTFVIEDTFNELGMSNVDVRVNADETVTFTSSDPAAFHDEGGGDITLNGVDILVQDPDTVRIATTNNPR
jgi:hypothetical protein